MEYESCTWAQSRVCLLSAQCRGVLPLLQVFISLWSTDVPTTHRCAQLPQPLPFPASQSFVFDQPGHFHVDNLHIWACTQQAFPQYHSPFSSSLRMQLLLSCILTRFKLIGCTLFSTSRDISLSWSNISAEGSYWRLQQPFSLFLIFSRSRSWR